MDPATAKVVVAGVDSRTKPAAHCCSGRAFTLVELLVVISILAMLMAVLLPSLGAARERGRRAVCMANLRSLGQAVTLYANDNGDRLPPGDSPISWAVWAQPLDAISSDGVNSAAMRHVNLGYLLNAGTLPMPTRKGTVLFCPSTRIAYDFSPPGELPRQWGTDKTAWVTYMYNDALDGFGCDVIAGAGALLAHKNAINFVRADGSVDVFRVQPLVFEEATGPETLVELVARYGVCLPTPLIFRWLERGKVSLDEARTYLADPAQWFAQNSLLTPRKPIRLADVRSKPLVCDIVANPLIFATLPSSTLGHG